MKEALKADDLNMRAYMSGGESEDEDDWQSSHSSAINSIYNSHNESVLNRILAN